MNDPKRTIKVIEILQRISDEEIIDVLFPKAKEEFDLNTISGRQKMVQSLKDRKFNQFKLLRNDAYVLEKDFETVEFVIKVGSWERRVKCPEKYKLKFLLDKGGEENG